MSDTSPTCWKRPSDVMRMHTYKKKKRALQARMDNARSTGFAILREDSNFDERNVSQENVASCRINAFKTNLSNRFKKVEAPSSNDVDTSTDNTLFQLLNQSITARQDFANSMYDSFANILDKAADAQIIPKPAKKKLLTLPIDFSLKYRLRFFSKKSFAWNKNLKTLEEASGTTGFSRCLNLSSEDCGASPSLDTGANAQFHQCCLVWQHPALPWLNLFPRTAAAAKTAAKINPIPIDTNMRECLHKAWRESFRSLLQLVRSHQCPYFYVCANKFTCLFRAAGIGGLAEIHAIITPTTSGFRGLLQKDEVVYSMPLKREVGEKKHSVSPSGNPSCSPDLENDAQDSPADTRQGDSGDSAGEEDGEAAEWLQSLGVAEAEIKKLNSTHGKQAATKASQFDRRPASLVLVEKDEEVQALFNLLLNCQSIVSPTGPLAGIPPTLLAPIAFHGATLKRLATSHRVVNMNGEQFQCVELSGPVLPHTLRDLCSLLEPAQPQFSISCSTIEHTRAFSMLPESCSPPVLDVFSRENLRDCGLRPDTLHALCQQNPIQVLESVKYSDKEYLCEN